MKELCTTFSLEIANGKTMTDSSDTWTWKSSYGQFRRIDYILHSKNLRSFNISANRELDLGSDHRNVSASIEYCRSPGHCKIKKNKIISILIYTEIAKGKIKKSSLEAEMAFRISGSLGSHR